MEPNLEQQKSQQACEILKELNLDSWLIWVRETSQMADPVLKLVLGIDLVWQSALLFSKEGSRVAIVGNFDAAGLEPLRIFDRVIPYTQSIREDLRKALQQLDPQQIGLNYSRDNVAADGLTFGMHKLLLDYLQGTPYANRFTSANALITRLRGRKIPEEIARIKKAIEITEQIYFESQQFVRVGQTEWEVYNYFHDRMKFYNVTPAWGADHNPAVDAGPNKQFGHAGPTENKIKAGHLLHFDFGVRHRGYCSDLQRMFYFGDSKEIPEEIQDAFNTVRDAIQSAAVFIKAGRQGHEVDTVARTFVCERGYAEYQHALGHQVGINAHDGGTLLGPLWDRYGDSPKGVIEVGNVFTLELYVTTKNFGQVSLEENIVVKKSGCEFLSNPQTTLICIE